MDTRKKLVAILVGAVGVMTAACAAAGTSAFGRATIADEGTVVHSRPLDECSAALDRNWNKLAQLQKTEDQLPKPPVTEGASAYLTEMAHR